MGYLEDYVNHVKEFGIVSQSPLMYALYSNVDDRTKYLIDDAISNVPFVGSAYKSVFTQRQLDDYMKNNPNVDWEHALRYHKYGTTAGAVTSAGFNFVSRNLDDLYNYGKKKKR